MNKNSAQRQVSTTGKVSAIQLYSAAAQLWTPARGVNCAMMETKKINNLKLVYINDIDTTVKRYMQTEWTEFPKQFDQQTGFVVSPIFVIKSLLNHVTNLLGARLLIFENDRGL